jgi:hypothetical protein
MHDGLAYVVACYALSVVVLAAWFGMIVRRLRVTRDQLAASEAGAAAAREGAGDA